MTGKQWLSKENTNISRLDESIYTHIQDRIEEYITHEKTGIQLSLSTPKPYQGDPQQRNQA